MLRKLELILQSNDIEKRIERVKKIFLKYSSLNKYTETIEKYLNENKCNFNQFFLLLKNFYHNDETEILGKISKNVEIFVE